MGVNHLGRRTSFDELMRMVREVAVATIQNSAVGRAGIRFYDAGKALFQGGGGIEIQDSGYIIIDGDLTGAGDFAWTGPWKFSGAGEITGDVAWSGDLNLTGDLNVTDAGRVKVGSSLTLNPAGSNGRIEFANGAQVFTDGTSIQLYLGNGVVQVSNSEAKIQVGGTAIRVTSGNIFVSGMATKAVGTVPGGFVGALVYDAGEMKRLI